MQSHIHRHLPAYVSRSSRSPTAGQQRRPFAGQWWLPYRHQHSHLQPIRCQQRRRVCVPAVYACVAGLARAGPGTVACACACRLRAAADVRRLHSRPSALGLLSTPRTVVHIHQSNLPCWKMTAAPHAHRFAIPVDMVRSSVGQIIQYGKVVRPLLGISFAPDQSAEQLGVKGALVLVPCSFAQCIMRAAIGRRHVQLHAHRCMLAWSLSVCPLTPTFISFSSPATHGSL